MCHFFKASIRYILLFLLSLSAIAQDCPPISEPQWWQQQIAKTNLYFYGYGRSTIKEKAKDLALQDLATNISVAVTKSVELVVSDQDGEVSSNLSVASRVVSRENFSEHDFDKSFKDSSCHWHQSVRIAVVHVEAQRLWQQYLQHYLIASDKSKTLKQQIKAIGSAQRIINNIQFDFLPQINAQVEKKKFDDRRYRLAAEKNIYRNVIVLRTPTDFKDSYFVEEQRQYLTNTIAQKANYHPIELSCDTMKSCRALADRYSVDRLLVVSLMSIDYRSGFGGIDYAVLNAKVEFIPLNNKNKKMRSLVLSSKIKYRNKYNILWSQAIDWLVVNDGELEQWLQSI